MIEFSQKDFQECPINWIVTFKLVGKLQFSKKKPILTAQHEVGNSVVDDDPICKGVQGRHPGHHNGGRGLFSAAHRQRRRGGFCPGNSKDLI